MAISNKEKLIVMRNAIDRMEGAMMGCPGLIDLPRIWGEPRHRGDLKVTPDMTAGQLYRICDALSELTRIINSSEYSIPSD